MPHNKNNHQQNKNHYHPRKHQHQNASKNKTCAAGRDAAYVQKQQSEQQEHLAKLLAKQHQEAEEMTNALRGPIGACMVPQLLGTLARNREAARHHETHLINEVSNNPNFGKLGNS